MKDAKKFQVVYEYGVNVRKEPSLDSEVVRVIPFGNTFEAKGTSKSHFLELEDGFVQNKKENVKFVKEQTKK